MKDCWCDFKFHLPGEKKKHLEAAKETKKLMDYVGRLSKRGRGN